MLCEFKDGHCTACGEVIPAEATPPYRRRCKNATPKLGDRVEAVTKALGIPTCGGCQKRKAALNKLSDWWRGED